MAIAQGFRRFGQAIKNRFIAKANEAVFLLRRNGSVISDIEYEPDKRLANALIA
ncbi:hypothetical protein [Paraburkholderia aspalathi]|uniref:hypothetical protein n=1 Tax=Paraburkholderia aspalathi TaxID=1324617 RepID=UPI0038B89DCA